jgi:hypothetical protein
MSVMAETSQSAMGPHVAVAAVGLALNSWAAVCREDGGDGKTQGGKTQGASVVKTQGGEDGGEDGGVDGGEDGRDGGGGLGDGGGGLGDGDDGGGGEGEPLVQLPGAQPKP